MAHRARGVLLVSAVWVGLTLAAARPASALATPEAPVTDVAASAYTSPAIVEISGTVQGGQVIEAVIMADAVPQPTSYSFRWYVDDQEITGATQQTLLVDPWHVDSRLTVVATPELDGYAAETGAGTSPASDPVSPAEHTGSLAVALPNVVQEHQVVTAVLGGDLSPEPTYTEYTWFVDGEPLEDAWEQSLDLSQVDVFAGSALAVTASSAAYGYAPVVATSPSVTVVPAPTLTTEFVNLPDGLGIRVIGEYFLDTGELSIEVHDDPLTIEEAASGEYPLDADPTVLGTVTPDADGSFLLESPFSITADSLRLMVRDANGVVLATEDHLFLEGEEPRDDTIPRLADSGASSSPAGLTSAALVILTAGVAVASVGWRRRRSRSA